MDVHLPLIHCALLRVDRRDDALRAEMCRRGGEELRVFDAGRVDADLVRARIEQRTDVVDRSDAAADGQRNEHLVRDRIDHVVQQSAAFDARADVEERELVGALLVVSPRHFHRIARIAQVDEVHPLHHAAVGDVEAGDDALRETHSRILTAACRAEGRRGRAVMPRGRP